MHAPSLLTKIALRLSGCRTLGFALGAIGAALLMSCNAEAGPLPPGIVDFCHAPPGARARCSVLTSVNNVARSRFSTMSRRVSGRPISKAPTILIRRKVSGTRWQSSVPTTQSMASRTSPPTVPISACRRVRARAAVSPSSIRTGKPRHSPGNAPADDDWNVEYALQMDMVSAACPNCNILLIEADNDQGDGLYVAVNTAASQPGVVAIALPYGGEEYSTETDDEQTYFNHPGIAMVAAGGDNGYGVSFPASSQYVVSVGATRLTTAANARGWTETAWNGTGSGCSQYISKPAFQHDPDCSNRTTNDIAIVGDPKRALPLIVRTTEAGSRLAVRPLAAA